MGALVNLQGSLLTQTPENVRIEVGYFGFWSQCSQGFNGFCFTNPSWAQEQKSSNGAIGIADFGPRAADRIGYSPQCCVLPDHSF